MRSQGWLPDLESGQPLGRLLVLVHRVDVRRGRALAAVADHRLHRVGRALQHDLDAAVAAVGRPPRDALVARRVAGRVAVENSLHLAVNDKAPADHVGGHTPDCRSVRVPSARAAMLSDSLMNALWLALGVIIGAILMAVALRPRLRALSIDAAHARELENRLVKASTELEQERARAVEQLATINDAQERLSASFKAMSADALQSSMTQLTELARAQLQAAQSEAKGDLEKRQQAVEQLVAPLKEQLGR